MRCWSPLTSTRCEPDRLVSVHPSRFSAASTRAALAMNSTVGHGYDKTGGPTASAPEFRAIHRWRAARQCQNMMLSTEPASIPSAQSGPLPDQLRRAVSASWPASRVRPASTPNLTCAATSPGAPGAAWTRSPPSVLIWSRTSGGCKKPAGSSHPPSPGGSPSRPGSTAPAPSTES